MNFIFKKAIVLPLRLAAIAASSLLVSCSNTARTDAQSASPGTNKMTGMDHGAGMNNGGMGHSMSMDLGPADANFDLRFIDGMTPHHEGAVAMAKEAQQKSKRAEVKQLAASILTSQQTEIQQMKQWRKAWYKL
jgi:uncharacterized protein (DUF305 family)